MQIPQQNTKSSPRTGTDCAVFGKGYTKIKEGHNSTQHSHVDEDCIRSRLDTHCCRRSQKFFSCFLFEGWPTTVVKTAFNSTAPLTAHDADAGAWTFPLDSGHNNTADKDMALGMNQKQTLGEMQRHLGIDHGFSCCSCQTKKANTSPVASLPNQENAVARASSVVGSCCYAMKSAFFNTETKGWSTTLLVVCPIYALILFIYPPKSS